MFDLLIKGSVEWLSWLKAHVRCVYTHYVYYTCILFIYVYIMCIYIQYPIKINLCVYVHIIYTEIDFNCHSGKRLAEISLFSDRQN